MSWSPQRAKGLHHKPPRTARTKNGKNLPPVLTTPSLKDTNHAVEGLPANVVDDQ